MGGEIARLAQILKRNYKLWGGYPGMRIIVTDVVPKIVDAGKGGFPRAIELTGGNGKYQQYLFPLFEGRTDISPDKLARYVDIFDANVQQPEVLKEVLGNTRLPMETIIQMQSPEFYNALLKTNTKMVAVPQDSGIFERTLPGISFTFPFSLEQGYLATGNYFSPYLYDLTKSGLEITEDDLFRNELEITDLSKIPGKTHLDLVEVPSFVTFHGNRFPSDMEFAFPGSRNYIGGGRYNKYGFYTADDYSTAEGFAETSQHHTPVEPTVHPVTVFGNPYFTDPYGRIEFMKRNPPLEKIKNDPFTIRPSYNITKAAFKAAKEAGYDVFIDPIERFRITDNPYYVKDLLYNNGNFDVTDISRFHKNGGRLVKHRFNCSCKNDQK